jgi:peroxiredoxin
VFCARELPSTVEEIHREFKGQGFTVIAVNIQEPKDHVSKWLKEKRVTSLILLDSDRAVSNVYKVTGTPTAVLIGRNGELVGRAVGPRDWTGETGRALLKALRSNRAG